MTHLTLAALDTADLDALVIGVAAGPNGAEPAPGWDTADAACNGRLRQLLDLLGATGAPEEITLVPADPGSSVPLVVAAGLGRPNDAGRFDPEILRRVASAAVRALRGRGRVGLTLGLVNGSATEEDGQAVVEGALLGGYQFDRYRRDVDRRPSIREVVLLVPEARIAMLTPAADRGRLLAEAVHLTRDLVNMPASELHPASFADLALATSREAGLDGELLDNAALVEGGYGGILAVGAGSVHPPRMVCLSWRPPDPVATMALVGKGVTFDSGGLTLKPRDGLENQKKDMVGAASVLATVTAAARLNVPLTITAYLPMVENMPGGSAYRPGDILRMRNGLHVEVHNTDAEGRLILADGLARACEDRPDYVLCVASLTGAQRVALGHRTCGAMGDEKLTGRLAAAGRHTGEPIWPMPLPEDIGSQLESSVADLANWHPDTAGGMLLGGMFLSRFVTEGTSWAHLDIAGPSYHSGSPRGYLSSGATGTPVRALVRLLEDLSASSS
ncbi:leucyl aminopeptidase [Nonomuraea sp. M3C6]|uniref:Probable cytosol aminopeptidase n=1 Tax=Nonomuraea marmarensis TaxID=3351344 RepID=A0ABW7AU33_9ACTN